MPIIGQRRPCRINWISRSTLAFVRPLCCWWRRNADATRWYGSHCIWTDVLCAAKRIGMIISKCRKFHRRTHSYSKWVELPPCAKPYISNTANTNSTCLTPFPSHHSYSHGCSWSVRPFIRLSVCFVFATFSIRFVSFRFSWVWFGFAGVCLGLPGLVWAQLVRSSLARSLAVCASSLGFWIRAFAFWLHTGNVWASLVLRCRLAFYKFHFLSKRHRKSCLFLSLSVYVCWEQMIPWS